MCMVKKVQNSNRINHLPKLVQGDFSLRRAPYLNSIHPCQLSTLLFMEYGASEQNCCGLWLSCKLKRLLKENHIVVPSTLVTLDTFQLMTSALYAVFTVPFWFFAALMVWVILSCLENLSLVHWGRLGGLSTCSVTITVKKHMRTKSPQPRVTLDSSILRIFGTVHYANFDINFQLNQVFI